MACSITASDEEKRKGRTATNRAIRDGRLKRPKKCEACKKACTPHAHHEDYTRPLKIKWLCLKCHFHRHGMQRLWFLIYRPSALKKDRK